MRVERKRKGKIKSKIRISRSRIKGGESAEPVRAMAFVSCNVASTKGVLD